MTAASFKCILSNQINAEILSRENSKKCIKGRMLTRSISEEQEGSCDNHKRKLKRDGRSQVKEDLFMIIRGKPLRVEITVSIKGGIFISTFLIVNYNLN